MVVECMWYESEQEEMEKHGQGEPEDQRKRSIPQNATKKPIALYAD